MNLDPPQVQEADRQRAKIIQDRLMNLQASEFSARELWHIFRELQPHNAKRSIPILEALWERQTQKLQAMLGEEDKPLRRFILHKIEQGEATWVPLSEAGQPYPNHRHDAAAVLHGLKPGVIVAIYSPKEGTAYESDPECPHPESSS